MPDILSLTVLLLLAQAPAPPAFVARPCPEERLRDVARCGTVTVPEDRAAPGGRTIDLNVVILPSRGPAALPPQYDIDGGPGLAVTPSAAFYRAEGAAYHARRDIVLVDQRGTGGSGPLSCPELEAPEAALGDMFPPDAVARCRAAVSRNADPAHYGTKAAVEDLEAVRAALGHERIVLFGLSYGTTVALRYLAAYPRRVQAALLMGVAPPAAMPPRYHASAAQRTLDLLFADCAADPACRAAFPDPEADLDTALRRLPASRPALSPERFMEAIRTLMYQPSTARRLPWIIHRAAAGDLAPFDAATRPQGPSRFSLGALFSITCGESFALMDYDAAAAAARATRFGDYRLRRQREACRHWPAAEAAPDHLAPPSGDTPLLILSGRLDPVTPPDWAEALAARFPRARHLVLRDSGHIFDGLSGIDTCLDPLMLRFLETADAAALDTACLDNMAPPPFTVSAPPGQ